MPRDGRADGQQLFCEIHRVFDWCTSPFAPSNEEGKREVDDNDGEDS